MKTIGPLRKTGTAECAGRLDLHFAAAAYNLVRIRNLARGGHVAMQSTMARDSMDHGSKSSENTQSASHWTADGFGLCGLRRSSLINALSFSASC